MRYAQKLWKSFASVLLGSSLVLCISSPIWANDAAFNAGKAAGNAGINQLQNLTSVKGAANVGVQIGQTVPASLTDSYKGQGKNGADAIGSLHQQGLSSMQASQQNCAAGDGACNAMKVLGNTYNNAVNGIDPTSAYKARAKAIHAAQMDNDPLAILGIGIPAQNGGNVCVNSTATAPSYQTSQSCMQATFQTIKYTPVLPVTSTITTASPYCIDPSMTLTANQALCTKTTYSCPSGGTLNGQQCTETVSLGYDYTSPYCIDPSMTMRGDKSLCEKQTYSCPNGGTLNGTNCVISTQTSVVSQSFSLPDFETTFCGDHHAIMKIVPDWQDPTKVNIIFMDNDGRCGYNDFSDAELLTYGFPTETVTVFADYPTYDYSTESVVCPKNTFLTCDGDGLTYDGYGCACHMSVTRIAKRGQYHRAKQFDLGTNLYDLSSIQYSFSSSGWGCHNVSGTTTGSKATSNSTSYNHSGISARDSLMVCPGRSWQRATIKMTGGSLTGVTNGCSAGYVKNGNTCTLTYPATASYTSAQPGCLGGRTFTGNSCQSVPVCPTGFSKISTTTSGITCSKTYPATANTSTASPGCYTPIIPAGAVSGGTQLAATMVNGQAGMTCQTTHYSCPAGMSMNGMMCEDPSTVNYANNPNCKRLGVNMSERTQGFLCINNRLDECAELDLTGCVSAGSSCVHVDDVVGSNTYNQCIATEKKYTCIKPQQTANISRCGYEPMCYNGNCFTPPGTKCAPTATGDECTTDLSQVMVGLETARQAGNYMTQDNLKLFSGESDRCDRRAVSVLGAGIGSKSCCNTSAPDAKPNSALFGSPIAQGVSVLGSGISAGSSYVYDYMMSSQKFVTAAQEMWAAGALTDNMAQQGLNAAQASAESLANFNFSPSVSLVPGLSIGYGAIPTAGTGTTLFGAGTTATTVTGATATTTTTVAGVSTTTTTTAIGNTGFNISYNPTMLYITAAMMAWQAYNAALACDEEDYKSSTKSNAKLCYDYGSWCAKKDCGLFGCTCTKFRTGKCCFNSKLARIINQQGRAQLSLSMSDCGGFTVAQIQQLDWSRIDLSEFTADMLAQAQQSASTIMSGNIQQQLQDKLTNSTVQNITNKVQPRLPVSQ